MRILQINKFLYPKGGDAITALTTGNLLKLKGHQVLFWGMKNKDNPSYPNYDLFIEDVDLNISKGIKKQFKIASNLLYSFEAKTKIEKFINREGRPDIVHLHNFAHQISPSILYIFHKYKIPCVMTMHDYKIVCGSYTLLSHGEICERCKNGFYFNCFKQGCVKDSKAKSLLNSLEMYLHHKIIHVYDLIDLFISPSLFLKNKVEEMGFKGEIKYLSNFIHIEDFNPCFDYKSKSICYVGRLSKEKGILTLIDSVKNLDIILKIIGDGFLKKTLIDKVTNEGIKNVSFLGYMSGQELKNEIQSNMFTVIPSEWYENNPRSVIESFALGKPVIGAQIGGIPELIKEGETGLTFISGNVQDLTNKIKFLIERPEMIIDMGKKARQYVENKLNANIHYEKLINIYQMAIDKKK